MTGIERLRRLARSQNMDNAWTAMLAHELCDIADQIERETEEQSARLYDERVGEETGVCELFGVGPVDDPLTSLRRHVESLNDTIENLRLELGEARDDAAWVREHGGLERVKKLLDWVVGHCSTRQQLDFDFWLSGRVMHELGFEEDMADRDEVERRLLSRLTPEGCEWPTVDGKPVDFVTGYEPSLGVLEAVSIYSNGACEVMGHDGIIKGVKEIHVATPKVLDADGVEIRVGDTVYDVEDGCELVVTKVTSDAVFVAFEDVEADKYDASQLTHRAPVLAADGEPLEVGQTVWDTNGDELVIGALEDGGHTVTCRYVDVGDGIPVHGMWSPSDLTHERPDSWERLEEDANASTCTYFGATTKDCEICGHVSWECSYDKASDLVRRAKKLAEVRE